MKKHHFYAVGFGVLMLFDTLTQVSIKLASSHAGAFVMEAGWVLNVARNPWVYGAVAGYIGAFIAWMTLLKHAPVGPAFAASHLGVVAVLVISVAYFGERFSSMQVVGALSIILGIVFLSLSEAKQAHD
ncbi:4-amino-4-deoxy-L-arabinose-phosphoundecaprenol flippase subunit ArnE [mine drainage metagenome]|uniref:4-amino-4-deoxy-L-arabinose-phosphoundecaprenol flippase subunit ArnE n=1 Tax=mine drainage metagenome TaxID=410659 RepID=A0A1J5R3T6_9ZZZZ